jgi:type I restriction enzyme, R subunit
LHVKSERARKALIKNKARQIIREFAPNNPVYYEKLRERLEKIIKDEEERRKENANYFNTHGYTQIYQEALNQDIEHKKLGFSSPFEFAVYSELQSKKADEVDSLRKITKSIYDKLREETQIVGWKTKTGSEKNMIITIYDIIFYHMDY